MNKTMNRIFNFAADVVGTAWYLLDEAKGYIPSILYLLSNLASCFATLFACTAIILQDAYTTLLPLCVTSARAGARVLVQGGTLLRASAPMLLNRLYEALRTCMDLVKESRSLVKEQVKEQAKEQVKRLQAYAIAAWQFRKECLA